MRGNDDEFAMQYCGTASSLPPNVRNVRISRNGQTSYRDIYYAMWMALRNRKQFKLRR